MKIKLLKDSRVTVKSGETVEVSPDVAAFLISLGSAVEVKKPKKKGE